MKSILHIVDSLVRGGAETLLINTVDTIRQTYPEVKQYVATLYRKGELESLIPAGVEVLDLGFNFVNVVPVIFRLRSFIKKNRIEIVHSHLIHSTLIARFALPKGVKLVTTYHSVFYDPEMVTYASKELPVDKLTYKKDYYTIYVSEAVRNNIRNAIGIKHNEQVLLNFASPKFRPLYTFNPDRQLRLVMVGNLHDIKNHEIAIRALARLKDLPITLNIYGEGHLRPFLENLIKETGANVTLNGSAAMRSEILKDYDCFMMTSHHEGLPLAILEAMQTGLPSILNNLSMLRETAGDSALYYDYDNLDSLVQVIRQAFENKQILEELSRKALVRSADFSASSYIKKLFSIYNLLLESQKKNKEADYA